ncbi:MAG: serine/threonine-protein kinase, partial [Gemmatimonadota bacterium]|nr:serine/threonine-protein kinase [Gemmatimonadota bacterium]
MSDPTSRLNAALEGRYRIERELGEGGMANVYLADDLKHERKVALKVLKPELAAIVGAERFLAEIKTTANLSHPHILPLFDSGEADGFLFYVMPHVEGETLRDRLDRDHQLPVNDAVQIAKNVAEALDYAHAQGVIHRDIKPANILLQAGKPVISDFGIALAVGTAGQGRLTETGLSMGTPHYMSPEQATGDLSVGAATDIYALGCVLYEMLVGEPPYTGSTAQAILGKIIAGELATATKQRASVPANVDAAIRRALEKLPADRFTGAHDFARALADPGFRYGEGAAVGAGPWKRVAIALGAVALLSTVGLGWSLVQGEADPTSKTVRFGIPVRQGAGASPDGGEPRYGRRTATDLAFSPDGETLVYASQRDGAAPPYLYTQRLDQDRADVIEAAGPGDQPFFSPDGAWIGFVGFGGPGEPSRPLKRISVADGTVETIAEMPVSQSPLSTGITWGDDGTIVVATGFERRDVEYSSLQRVEASGGEWEVLAETDPPPGQSWRFGQPHMLPGSETLLF